MRRLVGFFALLFLSSSDCRPVLAEDPVHHTFRYLTSSGIHRRIRGQFNDQNPNTYVVRRQAAQKRGNELQFVKPRPVRIDDNLVWCVSNDRHSFRNAFTGQPAAFLQTIDVNNIGLYAISPDQQKFAVVAELRSDNSQIAVEVFDIATQDRLAYVPFPEDSSYDIAFAPDNNRVLVAT